MIYFLLIKPAPQDDSDMELKKLFPTFAAIYRCLRPRKDAPRPLIERIEELEGILRQFLPYGVAARICCKLFQYEPTFDLQSPLEENTRYWLGRAIADFEFRVQEFGRRLGSHMTAELVERVKVGAAIYLPVFLPRLIVN